MECHMNSYLSLREKFEETKKELGAAEETIRRITGRDPDQFAAGGPGAARWKNSALLSGRPFSDRSFPDRSFADRPVPDRSFLERKRPSFVSRSAPVEETLPLDEESPDEEDVPSKKPTLQSTVTATPKDVKSRKDTIHEQNVDSKVTARNRRMLGMILGTLQRFQRDEKKRKEQEVRRAEVEQKVEAAAQQEQEQVRREREELFSTRKEKLVQLRCLEKKMEIAEMHEAWENCHKNLLNFIRTRARPAVFFLPASHNERSSEYLAESQRRMSDEMAARRQKVEQELSDIEEWYKKDSFPSEKENVGLPDDYPEPDPAVPPPPPEEEEEAMPLPEGPHPEEDGVEEKALVADQEFEPIYDE